jgi:rubrerythrin
MTADAKLPSDLSPLEVFSIAIRSEIEAREIYRRAAEKIVNEQLKKKLHFLREEEEKHRKIVEEMYRETFPDVPLELPDNSFLPKSDVAVASSSTVIELFEVAMEWERGAGEFYEGFSKRATDHRAKALLVSLSTAEWGHYHLLKSEYDLLKAFPAYADTKDFHPGEDFLHIGP